jgi:hypothetical protein
LRCVSSCSLLYCRLLAFDALFPHVLPLPITPILFSCSVTVHDSVFCRTSLHHGAHCLVSGLSLIRFYFLRDHVSPYSISVFGCFSQVHQVHFSMLVCRDSSICAEKLCNVSLGTVNTQPIKHMFIVPGDALHFTQFFLFCLSGHFPLFHHAADCSS